MSNPYSKLGYLAFKKEVSAGTAVKPDTYVELMSESLEAKYPNVAVTPIAGKRDVNLRKAEDKIEISGDVTVLVEAKNIGHFLQNFAGAPTTTTLAANKSYKHEWTLANSNEVTYTFDVKPADSEFVVRYTGVKIASMAFSQANNIIQCVLSIMGQKAFNNARVKTALGNGTALVVDQTSGLTTDDVVRILDKTTHAVKDTASVSAIVSELALTLGENATASLEDVVVIQKSTPIYTQSSEMTLIGGGTFKRRAGNEIANPIDNTNTKNCEDFTITFLNELEARYTAKGCNLADRFPNSIRVKGFTANGNNVGIYTNSEQLDDVRSGEQVAMRYQFCGEQIDTNSAVAAYSHIGTGNGQINFTASVAGEASNDINVAIIKNTADSLVASITGNNVLVKLANATTTSNTAILVASAVNALTGISAVHGGTGADEITPRSKFNLANGRDANEKEQLMIDLNDVRYEPYTPNNNENDLIEENVSWNAYFDKTDSRTAKITLRNSIASY